MAEKFIQNADKVAGIIAFLLFFVTVYNVNKDRFESMECFKKYKSYTNTNNIPTFCRDI